jgi:nitrite transporter NirC
MPAPIAEALAANGDDAVTKGVQVKSAPLKYFASSMLAGGYVGIAVVLMIMVSSAFINANSPATKLVQGAVFGIALTLVVFAGAELFTGNVMVMLQGLWARKVKPLELLMVWVGSLFGNLVGSLGFAALVAASGIINTPAPKGKQPVFAAALAGIIKTKVGLTGGQLFFRSILCNMLVCLGLWMAKRALTDGAKMFALWWALLAFVASGFEHSVANMTIFGIGLYTHLPQATASTLTRNLLWTVPGNLVGGGLLVGLAYSWIGSPGKMAMPGAPASAVPAGAVAAESSAPLVARVPAASPSASPDSPSPATDAGDDAPVRRARPLRANRSGGSTKTR